MKKIGFAVLLLAVVMLTANPLPGQARGFGGGFRGRGHIALRGGYGWGWCPWAIGGAVVGSALTAPYYYPPAPAVVQAPPPVYVEPEQQQEYYWYFCQNPQGYYLYVKSCPGGWMKVVPDANPTNPGEGMTK